MKIRFAAIVLSGLFPLIAGAKEKVATTVPSGAPAITSQFHSMKGVNGRRRSARHQGIDIPGPNNQPVIAVAGGKVLDVEIDSCWGPTVMVDHGRGVDGKRLIALYGHLGTMAVKKGQAVKRGQLVGRLGNNHRKFRCIAGVRHLHFQIGRAVRSKAKGRSWGHVRYLADGKRGVNPHQYWADGPGVVTCFRKGGRYPKGTITYPLPCK